MFKNIYASISFKQNDFAFLFRIINLKKNPAIVKVCVFFLHFKECIFKFIFLFDMCL